MNEPPPLSSAGSAAPNQAPTHCLQCGSPDFSRATNLPVCETCRLALVRRPFPTWVKASAAGILVLLLISVSQARTRWSQAVGLKQAEKLAHQGRWEDAFEHFTPFKETALNTEDMNFSLEYGEAAAKSGHLLEAAMILKKLSGRQANHLQIARANELEQTLISKLPPSAHKPAPPARQLAAPPLALPRFSTANNKSKDAPAPFPPTVNMPSHPAGAVNGISPDYLPPPSK